MTRPAQAGTIYGLSAYLIWGAMPVYFLILAPAGPWEILAHRTLWSALVCLVLLALTGRLVTAAGLFRSRRMVLGVTMAGLLIATNWTIYLTAVTSGRVTEAALGYFLNPLLSIALGLIVLRERLQPSQWVAVGLGLTGATVLAVAAGSPSWIALGLATSFGLYGLLKKHLGANLGALEGLAAETIVLAPAAIAVLVIVARNNTMTFVSTGMSHALLLVSTGIATAVPLLLFAAATSRVPLVTVGLLQFVAPVLQFITGLALGERMSSARWVGFAVVWCALLVLIGQVVYSQVHRQKPPPLAEGYEIS